MKKVFNSFAYLLFITIVSSCNGNLRFIITSIPQPHIIVRPISPGMGNIWIEGEWYWNGNGYSWHDGYWTVPRNGYRWNPGLWKRRKNGWYWRPGHWKR